MTAPQLSTTSLWISDIPGHGRVIGVISSGDHAAVLDDLNGDGREIELRIYDGASGAWELIGHNDDIDLPEADGSTVFGYFAGHTWTVGRTRPDARVEVTAGSERVVVAADTYGWWLAILRFEPTLQEDDADPWARNWNRGPRVRVID